MTNQKMMRRLIGVAAAGVAGALLLGACGGAGGEGTGADPDSAAAGFDDCLTNPNTCNQGEVRQGDSIVWVINANADGWMVDRTGSNSVYGVQAVDGVVPLATYALPDGSIEHNDALLTGLPELTSESPQQWTYQIRDEAVWSDGTPITADDFAFTWHLATGDDFGHCVGCLPPSTARSHQVDSVQASPDGKTVTVTLRNGESNPEWQMFFSRVWPAHIPREAGIDIDTPQGVGEASEWFNDNMPTWSGGPWLIVEGDLDTRVIKEPNPRWYGAPVNLDQVINVYNSNEGSWVSAIQTGEIHGGAPSATWPEDVIRQLRDIEGVLVGIQSEAGWEQLNINLDNEWLSDVELRRAIFTTVDSQEIAQRLFGDLFPDVQTAGHPIFRTVSDYYVDVVGETSYGTGDVALAEQILTDAGYEVVDGTLTKDGEQVGPLRLRATATTDRANSLQMIQAALGELGIESVIEHTDQLGEMLADRDYDIVQFGWSGSPAFTGAPTQYAHSDSTNNWGGYDNPQYDQHAEATANALTLDEAAAHATEAARVMMGDAYILPLFERPLLIFATDKYANIRDNAFSSSRAGYTGYQGWGVAAGVM